MKKLITLFFVLILYSSKADYWTSKYHIAGTTEYGGLGFGVGNNGYVGFGTYVATPTFLNFFELYDPSINDWEQESFFTGTHGVTSGFAIGSMIYVVSSSTDFWQFNASTNTWSQMANFTGSDHSSVGFSISTTGYYGPTATNNNLWAYDQSTNKWTQKANFTGTPRGGAVAFSIASYGYFGTGSALSPPYLKDFWQYDPSNDSWTSKADFPYVRTSAVGICIGTQGYIGTGYDGVSYYNDWYEYDVNSDSWSLKAAFPGQARYGAVGFSIGSNGYVGTGWDKSSSSFPNDFYEYTPDVSTNINEINSSSFSLNVYPNPVRNLMTIALGKYIDDGMISVYSISGEEIYRERFNGKEKAINCNFSNGIYLIVIRNQSETYIGKIIKE